MGTPATKQKVEYPVYTMDAKGKLTLPPHIISQIQFLHSHVGKTEWSGMLLYDVVSGSPSKPEEFELEAKQIFLMDVGSAAYTEYETDGDIVDIYDQFPEAMGWKTGHIHTHHNMGTYFSGTDEQELHDNVDKHNYYLSLIVNFDGNYTAKVVFLSEVSIVSNMTINGDDGNLKKFKRTKKEQHMVEVDMRIFFGGITQPFSKRIEQVENKAEEARKAAAKKRQSQYGGGYGGYAGPHNNYHGQGATGYRLPAHNQNAIGSKIIPDKMTSWEVEKLTRNVLMLDNDLKTEGNVYKILHEIARNDDTTHDLYGEYLMNNTEMIISNFFDNPLEADEITAVLKEMIMCIRKFESHAALKDIVPMIVGVFELMINEYLELEIEESGTGGNEMSIAEQLDRAERELQG